VKITIKLLTLLAACSVAMCAGGRQEEGSAPPAELSAATVATLGGEAVPYKSFQRYLSDNAGEEDGAEQDDAIKSRLLDQFLEEQLLLRAAADLKISISEEEIDSYLKEIGVTEGGAEATAPEVKEGFRVKVRQGLILQKLKDVAVLSKIQVTPGEVEDYIKKQPELARQSRTVVLRHILVDDRALADRLRQSLAADPSRFEALARENSVAPDRGQARTYSEDDLPVELRQPLFALEAGQISPVLENAQRYFIFKLERKVEPKEVDRDELRRRIRLRLFQEKGDQVLESYLTDLKAKTEIHINRAVLPFQYSGENKN
jgi:parvulin-like peptidyl-prolyl isomerase